MRPQDELADVRDRIVSVIETLDDITFTILREAARETGSRPAADKTLLQARRALEKAVRLIESVEEKGEEGFS